MRDLGTDFIVLFHSVLTRCMDPVLAKDAISQGCWCVRARSNVGLTQT